MQRSALITFTKLPWAANDERAWRKRLQATTKPRAKAYQVKPGQNHGSPRLASGYRYLEVLPKYSAISFGERKPVSPFVAQLSVMDNEDKSVIGKRKVERERMSGILQLNPQYPTNSFYHLSFSFFFHSFSSYVTSTLSLYDRYSRIRVSFFPIFFLFFCYPIHIAVAYDRNLNPPSIARYSE